MIKLKDIVDLIPIYIKKITPAQYLSISGEERRNIESCRFVPPVVGARHFGYFTIKLRTPVYSPSNGQGK